MPRKTDGVKIDELMVSVAVLLERVDSMQRELNRLSDLLIRVVLLEQRLNDIQQGWERWLQRLWMLLAPLVGAVAGSLLTYYLTAKK
jgi:uncharacterized membrane protein YoaK (UPF0700 family)